jgi:hypothetical protein
MDWIDPHEGTCYRWFATSKEAEATMPEGLPEGAQVTITRITIPDGKKALVEWLNSNFDRNNG